MIDEKSIARMFRRRQEALSKRDAVAYYRACSAEGVEPEDVDLFEQGALELDLLEERISNEQVDEQKPAVNVEDREYWSRLTITACTRFPETEPGERISEREIKGELGKIRKDGYPVKPYSHLTRGEAWEYLLQIKAHVASQAEIHCPDVLARVRDANEQARYLR